MCPSIAVLAGGGDGGGGSGEGAGDGDGDNNADGSGSGEGAEGDQRGAPDYARYPECGYASHPVDVVTGRAFTHPIHELSLPGPLPLSLERMYSSKAKARDVGLGPGWTHTFGWEVEVLRRRIIVWNEQGIAVDFPVIPVGGETLGPWGWVLRRESWGFAVDAGDGLWHLFSAGDEAGKRFRLTAIQDRNKNRIALTYEDGRLVEIVDSAGRMIRVVSTNEGRIASFQIKNAVAEGRWIAFATYAYDDRGRLVTATDADGFSARYAYDEDDRLSDDADRTGLTFHFRYDREDRCIESWGDYPGRRDPSLSDAVPRYLHDGVTRLKGIHHCKFEYFPEGYSEVADSTQVRRFFGTIHGTLSKSVEGGAVMTAEYRSDGHILSRTDALGGNRQFHRDARGRLVRLTDELQRMTTIQRDGNGLPIQVDDAAGGTTTIDRDARGNVTRHVDAAGGVTTFRTDERGLVLEIVGTKGERTAFAYDEQGNLLEETDPRGGRWGFTYDAFGQCTSETDPTGATTRYAWSPRGDLLAEYDAIGGVTRYAYDGEHHVTQVVNPKGHVTALTWGGYHKLCDRTDANSHITRLRYNVEGELVEVHNERGEVFRLEYDSSGRLIREDTFDGRRLEYQNDVLGRPTRITDGARRKTHFAYDLAGNFIERKRPDDEVDTFEYDALDNLVRAVGPDAEVRIERDVLGRIVRETQVFRGDEQTVESELDPTDERIQRKTSLGHVEVMERDVLGARVRTLLDQQHEIIHGTDALGREITRALPEGGLVETAYDPLGRLAQHRAGGAREARSVGAGEPAWIGPGADNATTQTSYRYDWDGELIETFDKLRGRTEYRYDPVGQLLASIPEKGRAELFAYDPTGNLYEAGPEVPRREYGKGNRLSRRGNTLYRWDDDGHLEAKESLTPEGRSQIWRYRWGATGLLQSVLTPDGKVVEFLYDPFARRVFKSVSTASPDGRAKEAISTTRFVWDGDVLVHEIRQTARPAGALSPVVRTYCFEDDSFAPAAHREGRADASDRIAAGDWYHYLTDTVGTPEAIVGADGRLVERIERGAWHLAATSDLGPGTTALRYPGQYQDEETGLAYNRFRYYDPSLGLFVSADPLGLEAGLNFFGYCPSSLTWLDPLGLAGTMRRRRRMNERIEAARQQGGNQTVRGSVSPREARRRCREQAGEGSVQGTADNGAAMRTSADGTRRSRAASEKRSEHTRTGTQINLETGTRLNAPDRGAQNVLSNVHVDVRRR